MSDIGQGPPVDTLLLQADDAIARGALGEAERLLRHIVLTRPDDPRAYSKLAAIASASGSATRSLEILAAGLARTQEKFPLLLDRSLIHFQLGRLHEALLDCDLASGIDPARFEPFANKSVFLDAAGDLGGAVEASEAALTRSPEHPRLIGNLIRHALKAGQTALAQKAAAHGANIAPNDPDLLLMRAQVALAIEDAQTAGELADLVLESDPENVAATIAKAAALARLGDASAGVKILAKLHAAHPGNLEVAENLASLMAEDGRLEEARALAAKLLGDRPHAVSYFTLARIELRQHNWRAAISNLRQALSLDPSNWRIHTNLADALLSVGELEEGLREYEWRSGNAEWSAPLPHKMWRGEPLQGRHLHIEGEQGLGDELLFASMIKKLFDQGAILSMTCSARLVSLFKRSFPGAVVAPRGTPPPADRADLWVMAGSIAHRLGVTSADGLGPKGPILIPDPTRVEFWRQRLDVSASPILGISWRSMPRRTPGPGNYWDLEDLKVFTDMGIRLVCLQYGFPDVERDRAQALFGDSFLVPEGVDLKDDLDEVAAIIAAMPLVIVPQNTVSGLAGAVGTETWRFSTGHGIDTLGSDHVPWLPAIRQFMRGPDEDWASVRVRMAHALRERFGMGN